MSPQGKGKTAVMIGAGNIGRGFVGAAFASSGFETVFIDIDKALVATINDRGEYPVRLLSPDGKVTDTYVRGVRAVHGSDINAAASEISRADICATAVGVRALPYIASMMAQGLAQRAESGLGPLNTIVCENMQHAGERLREYIREALPDEQKTLADKMAGFPDAVIGRMVPVQTEEMKAGDALRICVEEYDFIPVDKAAFKGGIPQVKGITPLDHFTYYVKRKLFIHNMGHAAIAYLGLLGGYTLIAEAAEDPSIMYIAASAMRQSATALSCENTGDAANLNRHIDSLLYRFYNRSLGDTCERVAADPERKLSKDERIIGAIENCESFGLPMVYIAAVAAAAAVMMERTRAVEPQLSLAEVTGLSKDSETYQMIDELYRECSAALQDGADGITALRRAAVRIAGGIRIL